MADNDFSKLNRKSDQVRQLLTRMTSLIGTEAVNFSKKRFRDQGWQDENFEPWAKRSPGAVRNEGRAILVNSGRLRNSIAIKRISPQSVTIGTDVKYAQVHNDGGDINIPVTDKMRRFGWAKYKQTGDSKFKGLALTKKTSIHIKMPQRKFMGNSAVLRQQTVMMIKRRFNVILNAN